MIVICAIRRGDEKGGNIHQQKGRIVASTKKTFLMFTEEFSEGMIKEDLLNAQNHTMID